ncbi:MAG: TrkH family potassium uptake protein [Rhodospirillales bacterium]|nr:TrkH family potassium uptake protein [Rhodospirillales bacterium]MDP6642544.1 TrkH family potassium uptake protein [Rhodospirillales bacterium]MDP6841853.1 TrkH family potassium uptake protein [Rhodospirillales bacterium]
MFDFRPIFLILGTLLTTLAVVMAVPAAVDVATGHPDWQVFAVAAGVTLFIGVSLALTSRAGGATLSTRQAFILTTLAWIVLTVFAALPFAFSQLNLSFTDAFFEAMSGVTTTGATVIQNLETVPPGLLLWRALLQWFGGIGIIVMALAVLPMLRVGGMQLFRLESSDQSEKAFPRAAQVAAVIGIIYLGLTALWAGAMWLAGMSGFDAIAHAMTTIATGGYSTRDASIGHYDNWVIDVIVTLGMIVGSLPFLLYLLAIQGNPGKLFRDTQVQWFLTTLVVVIALVGGWLWLGRGIDPIQAVRLASFNVVSIMTGTGYATAGFDNWGSFVVPIFFFIMFVGGCAGSTTCGIKIFRFQVLYAAARAQFQNLAQPHGVFIPYYNRNPIPDEVTNSVMSFFFVFGATFAVLAMLLAMLGLDFLTSVSAAAAAIANVGPGLGPVVGPEGDYTSLPVAAKWLLSAGMLLGRLELFTVMVLFTRAFWRA